MTAKTAAALAERAKCEPVSAYQLQQLLKGLAEVVERMPVVLSKEVQEAVDFSIEEVTVRMSRCLDSVKEFEAVLMRKQQEVCDHFDQLWEKVKTKRAEFSKRRDALPELADIKLPHGFRDLFEAAQRWSHLTDKQWARLIELAKALAEKEG